MGLPVEFVIASGRCGVEKPSPEFFARIARAAGTPASRLAYVGDRLDNDVLPAKRAGMLAIFLVRGPWGHVHDTGAETVAADARITSLAELLDVLPRPAAA